MSLKSEFGTDKSKELSGVEIEVTENEDGSICSFTLARAGSSNKKFTKAMAKKASANRNRSYVSQDRQLKDALEVFVDTVLLGWKNVAEFREDKLAAHKGDGLCFIPYTKENAIWLLQELPDLFDVLTTEATNRANFQESARENEAKNSSPFSKSS